MARSMVERLDLDVFWQFSMVGVLCTTDLNHYLLVVFYSFLCVISVILTNFLYLGSRYFLFLFIFVSLEINLHRCQSVMVVWLPPLLWGSQYWVVGGVNLQLSYFNRAFCAHFSWALCAQLVICLTEACSPILLSDFGDINDSSNLGFYN